MKCGTTASIFTFLYLHELREELYGRLTLSAVSDEETFGPWGARYLSEHHPEVFGDCCLNGEPSSPWTLRFGEKGPLWLEFTVRTRGAHGAYTHLSKIECVADRLRILRGEQHPHYLAAVSVMLEDLLADELTLAIAVGSQPDPFGPAQRLSNGFELGRFVAALGPPGAVKTFGPQQDR